MTPSIPVTEIQDLIEHLTRTKAHCTDVMKKQSLEMEIHDLQLLVRKRIF